MSFEARTFLKTSIIDSKEIFKPETECGLLVRVEQPPPPKKKWESRGGGMKSRAFSSSASGVGLYAKS